MAIRKKNFFSEEQITEAAHLFGLLADASRLRLLKALMNGEHSVGELVQETGLTQANVSKHLSLLYSARLVERRKNGPFVIYRLRDSFVADLCELICGHFKNEAGRLAKLLAGR
jgi:DNA-binding transcriptional ArsR family regulator